MSSEREPQWVALVNVIGPHQRTPEWYAARRTGITSTDIVAILGLSRYRSEGDVAREKRGEWEDLSEDDVALGRQRRIGRAMESVVAAEDEREHGWTLVHADSLIVHPEIEWAMTSLDYVHEPESGPPPDVIVEIKTSSSREWEEGLPMSVEAQVRWQMGVTGIARAHVAALRFGNRLECYDVEHDESVWRNLLAIAEDFRTRLAAGGPFDETRESARRAWPVDDGSEIVADEDVAAAVVDLLVTKANIKQAEAHRDHLEGAIQSRMGTAAVMTGPGFRVSWRRGSDVTHTDWRLIAEGFLRTQPDDVRETLVSLHSVARPGRRPFIVREVKE